IPPPVRPHSCWHDRKPDGKPEHRPDSSPQCGASGYRCHRAGGSLSWNVHFLCLLIVAAFSNGVRSVSQGIWTNHLKRWYHLLHFTEKRGEEDGPRRVSAGTAPGVGLYPGGTPSSYLSGLLRP